MARLDQLDDQGCPLGSLTCASSSSRPTWSNPDVRAAPRHRQRRPGADGVLAVEPADDDAAGRQPLVQDDLEVAHGVGPVADRDGDPGGQGRSGGAPEQALLGGRHPRAMAAVATSPAGPRRSTRGTTMPSVTSLAKRSANLSAGQGVGGFVCGVRK